MNNVRRMLISAAIVLSFGVVETSAASILGLAEIGGPKGKTGSTPLVSVPGLVSIGTSGSSTSVNVLDGAAKVTVTLPDLGGGGGTGGAAIQVAVAVQVVVAPVAVAALVAVAAPVVLAGRRLPIMAVAVQQAAAPMA